MVLFRPIEIHGSLTHRLKGALHANGPDINVGQNPGHEKNGSDAVSHFGDLHAENGGDVERENEEIAADGHGCPGQNDHPEDTFLPGIESVGRGMIVSDDTATTLDPLDVSAVWYVPAQPYEKDQYDAQRKGEAEKVMGVFGSA